MEKLWSDGKRLRPREVVAEFEKTLRDELDLIARGRQLLAAAAQLRALAAAARARRCTGTTAAREVMVMERMSGIPIAQVDRLRRGGHRPQAAVARRRRALLHAGVPRRATSTPTCIPGNIFVAVGGAAPRQVHRRRLRHHGDAVRAATRATSRRTSSPSSAATTTASRPRTSSRAGCRRTRASTSWRAEIRVVLRAGVRPAADGDLARQGAAAAVHARRAGSTSRSSRSSCCCRRRC